MSGIKVILPFFLCITCLFWNSQALKAKKNLTIHRLTAIGIYIDPRSVTTAPGSAFCLSQRISSGIHQSWFKKWNSVPTEAYGKSSQHPAYIITTWTFGYDKLSANKKKYRGTQLYLHCTSLCLGSAVMLFDEVVGL